MTLGKVEEDSRILKGESLDVANDGVVVGDCFSVEVGVEEGVPGFLEEIVVNCGVDTFKTGEMNLFKGSDP